MVSKPLNTSEKFILKPEFLERPRLSRENPDAGSFWDYLTFKNVVIWLGVLTFIIFLGSAVSPRIAFLFMALLGLVGLVVFEMSSRRKWEHALLDQLQKMNSDYDRLVRETARNRNDLAALKKNLAAAGTLARSYNTGSDAKDGNAAEQRMAKSIAEQLAKMGDAAVEETGMEGPFLALDTAVIKKAAATSFPEGKDIGSQLSDDQVLQLVNAAVRQDRIDLFLQSVVNLPQRKTRFYEMFSRIRIKPGVYLPAERYIAVAMTQDLVPVIDNLLLLRGLQFIRDTETEDSNRAFFCNITSLTLDDPKFMGDLVEFIAQNRTLAPRLMFELGQVDLATMRADTLPVLNGLARLGCRFSMDRVRSLSFDFSFLEAHHIRFIKVEAGILLLAMKETGGFQRLKRLKSELDAKGIDLIVEKIETERQLITLLDLGIDYGQGFLFSKPQLASAV
jgi:cyclic-di-GMP phosphodiesterase TipF (flagellum assembly factor)